MIAQVEPSATPLTALLVAADRGDASRVARARSTPHPEIVNSRGTLSGHTGFRTALHFGISTRGRRALLERGANPNVRDDGDNAIPLHFAAENGDSPSSGSSSNTEPTRSASDDGHELEVIGWLRRASGNGNKEIVDYLLAHGSIHNILSLSRWARSKPSRPSWPSRVPISIGRWTAPITDAERCISPSSRNNRPRSLRCSISARDTEALDASGLTPLDQAALDGEHEMAELLIARGARVGVPAALGLQRTDDLERLLRDDPDCLAPGNHWAHLIVRAGAHGSAKLVDTLVSHGASVNVRDDPDTSVDSTQGYTALHAAGFHGNAAAAAALLKHGADPTIRDDKYLATPAGWADFAGHKNVRDLILAGPIDIFEAIDFDLPDRIPEILARDPGAFTRPFRDYAPDEWTPDEDNPEPGATPLAWAIARNKVAAARVLAAHGAEGSKRQ